MNMYLNYYSFNPVIAHWYLTESSLT